MDPKKEKTLAGRESSKNSFSISHSNHVHLALPRRSRSRLSMQNQLLFSFNPSSETFENPLPLLPGIHSFIQIKDEPHTIYCRHNRNYLNTATTVFVEHFVCIDEEDLFTAGEMIVDASHKIIAWSFHTKHYAEELNLTDQHIMSQIINKKPSKLDLCGLPVDKFYFSHLWSAYNELPISRMYFDIEGHFKPSRQDDDVNKPSLDIIHARFKSLNSVVELASSAFIEEKVSQSTVNTVMSLTSGFTLPNCLSPVSKDLVTQNKNAFFQNITAGTQDAKSDATSSNKPSLAREPSL